MKNKIKFLLIRLKIHRFFPARLAPPGILKNLLAFSAWADQQSSIALNDFYNPEASYEDRRKVFEFILENEIKSLPVDYFEFGVEDAATFKWWMKKLGHPECRFYGFDSFEGLPEDWGIHRKGSFSMEGSVPAIDDERGTLMKGLFQDVLPAFLQNRSFDKPKVVLLDADLYSSTIFVLRQLATFLNTDDILVFDEFNSVNHEFRAFNEFCSTNPRLQLHAIASAGNHSFVAFKLQKF